MKKIIVAPDSFKGSISAPDAARAIADGIHEVCPEAQTVIIPIADGGEGTLEALTTPECRMIAPAFNTNGAPAEALIGYIGNTAVIESAPPGARHARSGSDPSRPRRGIPSCRPLAESEAL
ncbi:glycerate kinase [Anaerotruncus sp. CAG:390]|nr:glycerate kinase [Anaerotruncus sp. CAG:390]